MRVPSSQKLRIMLKFLNAQFLFSLGILFRWYKMQSKDIIFESTKKALVNFENIKECIQGLYEILKIALPNNNIYLHMGQDNIEALYQNFIELMVNELGTKEFMKKVKTAEIDLDLPLENI